MKAARVYRQGVRAQQASANEERILDAAERLFATELFDRVSLAEIAQASGVSIPTLQRRFGSKDGLFEATGRRVRERVLAQRRPPGPDLDSALAALLDHYEQEGAMVWHLLRQENDVPALAVVLAEARRMHRVWIEEVYAPLLDGLEGEDRHTRVDALVAATDLYLWKLCASTLVVAAPTRNG
ncbi:MAG: TetR/AcrR family transcriptional regulator [Micropruina sp.]|nr:TetR/AcrR family transcriptional regulator [Micropruina sp.]